MKETVASCASPRRTAPLFSVCYPLPTLLAACFSLDIQLVLRRDAIVLKGNVTRYGRGHSAIPLFCVRNR